MPELSQPWWLIALAVVPVIRWLHRRHSPLSWQNVSALFLWQDEALETGQSHDRRPPDPAWRRRALIAALLVMALADPTIRLQQRALTVWLDSSPSMQTIEAGEARLDVARRLLDAELQDADFDKVSVNLLSGQLPLELESNSLHWLVSDASTETTRNWAQEKGIDRVIYVGTETENVALIRLSARRSRTQPGQIDILASVGNSGTETAERQLNLLRDDETVATTTMTLQAGEIAHWRVRVPDRDSTITAVIDARDALRDDDRLSITDAELRRLAVSVHPACGAALQAAIRTHPALVVAGEPDIAVECPREPSSSETLATNSVIARIRAISGRQTNIDEVPYWLPGRVLNTNLHLPTELLSAADWPVPTTNQSGHILLQTGEKPLVVFTPATGQHPSIVETVIDLERADFARQPEYAALVANLVDAAMDRRLLDEPHIASREFAETVIRPGRISVEPGVSTTNRRAGAARLDRALILLVILLLAADIALLVLARRRAARV